MAIVNLEELGIVAIVRHDKPADLLSAARALAGGGLRAVEITLNTPGALEAISQIRDEIAIGAGTILEPADADRAIDAGAQFIVTPTVQLDTIALCRSRNIPIACGCMTPTEALAVYRAGADYLKIFPADSLGPAYLKALLGPMPFLKLVPTGGVSLGNLAEFFKAGCRAVAIGGNLVSRQILEEGDWLLLESRARAYAEALTSVRAQI